MIFFITSLLLVGMYVLQGQVQIVTYTRTTEYCIKIADCKEARSGIFIYFFFLLSSGMKFYELL